MFKGLVGNNPQALLDQLAKSNATCRLPNGTQVPVSQVLEQCKGKTPQEAFSQFGLDFSQFQALM